MTSGSPAMSASPATWVAPTMAELSETARVSEPPPASSHGSANHSSMEPGDWIMQIEPGPAAHKVCNLGQLT